MSGTVQQDLDLAEEVAGVVAADDAPVGNNSTELEPLAVNGTIDVITLELLEHELDFMVLCKNLLASLARAALQVQVGVAELELLAIVGVHLDLRLVTIGLAGVVLAVEVGPPVPGDDSAGVERHMPPVAARP